MIFTFNFRVSRSRSRGRDRERKRSPPPPPGTKKIRVFALTRNVSKDHLTEIFSTYGKITELDYPYDRHMGFVCAFSKRTWVTLFRNGLQWAWCRLYFACPLPPAPLPCALFSQGLEAHLCAFAAF